MNGPTPKRLSPVAIALLLSSLTPSAWAQPRRIIPARPPRYPYRPPAAPVRPPPRLDADPYGAATQPAVTQPAVTQPAATQPAVTQPAVTQPAVTQPDPPPAVAQTQPTQPQTPTPLPPLPTTLPLLPSQPAIDTQGDAATPAQPDASQPAPTPASTPAPAAPAASSDAPEFVFHGWAELYYAYNFNGPSNGINAYRIYDIQHDHIGFNNLAFDLAWKVQSVHGHTAMQFGALAAEAYYPATTLPRAQQELLWRVLQEVTFGWSPRLLGRTPLSVDAGLFVAPFGVEYVEIYKNWNWSPSNLFYIAPFQMTGARASWTFSDALTVRAGIYSGWDRVIDDNNGSRTALFQAEWAVTDKLFLNFQYMFGVERDRSAREGPWVRHTFDHWGEFEATSRLQVRWHAFAGVEPNRLGVSAWAGVAAYARFKFFDWLFAATRFEVLHEWVPAGSRSMFDLNDATTLGEGTLTVEALPHPHFSVRAEYRHDLANGSLFYRGDVLNDRMSGEPIANASWQDTLSLGVTAWF